MSKKSAEMQGSTTRADGVRYLFLVLGRVKVVISLSLALSHMYHLLFVEVAALFGLVQNSSGGDNSGRANIQ